MSSTVSYADRRALLAAELEDAGCDAIVVDHPQHVRWLTGFTGSSGAVLVYADGRAMVSTDGRYTTQIGVEAPDLELHLSRNCAIELAGRAGVKRLGFEAGHVTVAAMRRIAAALDAAKGEELVETADLVEKLRAVKDDAELEALRAVADIAVKAFEGLLESGAIAAGNTERDVAAELEHRMRIGEPTASRSTRSSPRARTPRSRTRAPRIVNCATVICSPSTSARPRTATTRT